MNFMTKKKNKDLEEIYYPVPANFSIESKSKPTMNSDVIRQIITGAVKGAYKLKNPSDYDLKYGHAKGKPKAIATEEQMNMVIHLIESLQPSDAIEAALASQFAITYIRGIEEATKEYSKNLSMVELFEFGHKVLETLNRYRTKGAQMISVNYNHNQGQINNIKVFEKDEVNDFIEVNQNE
jgi:hypothetical protein